LSALSGLLLFLSFPNVNFYFLAWVALIPILLIIKKLTPKGAFFTGLLSGFAAYAGIFYWIFGTIKFNTGSNLQSILALSLLCLYLGLYVGVWALGIRLFASGFSVVRFSIFSGALWVALEYIRTYALGGFPWAIAGYSQWKFLPVIQIAEFTGVYGVSFILVAFNCGLSQFIKTKKWHTFFGLLSALAVIIVSGIVMLNRNTSIPPPYIKAAVIQPNIDQYKKWDESYKDEIIKTLTELALTASKDSPDIIIWPETAVPGYLPYDQQLYGWVNNISKETNTLNLIGAPYYNGGRNYHNATFLFGQDGEILGWHIKTHLVPFGEYVPFRKFLAPYFGILNTLGDFTAGKEPVILSAKSVMLGTTICSENFFGATAAKFVKKGANILINQTNDAWFFKTSAQKQHFVMNVFRAVENRRPVVACGNTGISGMIERTGRVANEVPYFQKTYFTCSIAPRRNFTFYTVWGDVFAQLCSAFVLIIIAFNFYIKYRRRKNA